MIFVRSIRKESGDLKVYREITTAHNTTKID